MTFSKFLKIACGCHCRPDRSFFYKGKQFPVCARCTGILIGYIIGIVFAVINKANDYQYYSLLVLPMIADGTIQKVFKKESNNIRRLITGILGGVGIIHLFITYHYICLWVGTSILKALNFL